MASVGIAQTVKEGWEEILSVESDTWEGSWRSWSHFHTLTHLQCQNSLHSISHKGSFSLWLPPQMGSFSPFEVAHSILAVLRENSPLRKLSLTLHKISPLQFLSIWLQFFHLNPLPTFECLSQLLCPAPLLPQHIHMRTHALKFHGMWFWITLSFSHSFLI